MAGYRSARIKRLWSPLFTVTMVIDEVLENGVLYRAILINIYIQCKELSRRIWRVLVATPLQLSNR